MSTALAIIEPDLESKQLWREVKDQYGRATGGMREVLKFGAMMMVLEAHLDQLVQVGQASRKGTDGSGLKGLLAEHAPEINRSTAYRFRDVAKAVQKAYELPARVTKQLPFEQLVTADPKKLDETARNAQEKVYEFVDGTSQRSLLDEFKVESTRGGSRASAGGKQKRELTADQIAREEAQIKYLPLQEKIFELIHDRKNKERILFLPLTAPAKKASLTVLLSEVDELRDLLKHAIKQHKHAAGRNGA